MAKFVLEQLEQNPENSDGVVLVAYFDGTPTSKQLDQVAEKAVTGADAVGGERERRDNVVAKRAGLQRWLLWPG